MVCAKEYLFIYSVVSGAVMCGCLCMFACTLLLTMINLFNFHIIIVLTIFNYWSTGTQNDNNNDDEYLGTVDDEDITWDVEWTYLHPYISIKSIKCWHTSIL